MYWGGNNSLLPPNSLSDGTALFIVRDIRCKYRTGEIVALMCTPKEQDYLLLCDGSQISAELYPELVAVLGNNTLPNLIDGKFLEGWITSGEYKAAGLPNIEGSIGLCPVGRDWVVDSHGAVYGTNFVQGINAYGFSPGDLWKGRNFGEAAIVVDASRSNSIYGLSTTVQPKSMTIKYYICYAG